MGLQSFSGRSNIRAFWCVCVFYDCCVKMNKDERMLETCPYVANLSDKEHISIVFAVPSSCSSRDIDVVFEKSFIRAGLKDQVPVVEGKLYDDVEDACIWQLEASRSGKQKLVTIFMDRTNARSWPILVKGPRVQKDLNTMDSLSLYNFALYLIQGGAADSMLEFSSKSKEELSQTVFDYMKLSAQKGFSEAQLFIYRVLTAANDDSTFKVEKDVPTALEYLSAAATGLPLGQVKTPKDAHEYMVQLSKSEKMQEGGTDESKDGEEGKTELESQDQEATLPGSGDAQVEMGHIFASGQYEQEANVETAVFWYNAAITKIPGVAGFYLGSLFGAMVDATMKKGDDPKQLAEVAISYWLKAMEHGNAKAAYNLGVYCMHGIGLPANLEAAYKYFQIANRMDKALTPPEELLKLYEHQKQLRQAKSSPAKSSSNPLTSSTPTPTETADGGSSRGRSIQRKSSSNIWTYAPLVVGVGVLASLLYFKYKSSSS